MADQVVSVLGTFEDRISGPARTASRAFLGFEDAFKRLDRLVAPLTGRLTALFSAFAGAQFFRASLAEAEKQANAEARLLNALRGREQQLERIKRTASDLQRVTATGDDAFLDYAATLLNVGVAADDVDAALRAVADTAVAVNQAPEAIIRALAAVRSGEVGRLGQLVPELKDVVDAGGSAADVIKVLAERFGGAAEAIADTPFGQYRQELNLVGDAQEKVGEALVRLRTAAVRTAREGLERLVDGLDTPAVQGFLEVLEASIPAITQVALKVGAVVAGVSLLRAISPFIPALAVFFGLGAAVDLAARGLARVRGEAGGAASGLLAVADVVDQARDTLARTRAEFASLLQEIAAGRLPVSAFFDRIKLQFENTVDFLKSLFIEELKAIVGAAPDILLDLLGVLGALFGKLGVLIRLAIEEGVNAAVQAIRRKFPRAADFFGLSGERIELVSQESIDAVDAVLAARLADLGGTFDDIGKDVQAGLGPVLDRIAQRNADFEESLARQRQAIASNTDELRRQLALQDDRTGRLREEADLLLRSAEDARVNALTEQSSLATLEAQLAVQDAIAEEARQRVDAVLAERADLAELESSQARTLETAKAQSEVEADLVEAARQLQEVEQARAETVREIASLRSEEAAAVLSSAEAERGRLDQELQSISAQRQAGVITQGQAIELSAQATERFRAKLDQARAALEALAASLPPDRAAELRTSIEGLGAGLDGERATGFFEGVVQGARKATVALDDMGQVGVQVGEQLVDSLATGLADVFVRGTKSLREFLGEFLQAVAQIIVKLLILKALKTVLGDGEGSLGGIIAGLFANRGGLVPALALAGGGSVPGPSVNRDVVPAVLTPGEFVQPRSVVGHYGAGVMEAMRQMLIPRSLFAGVPGVGPHARLGRRFAAGGSVAESTGQAASLGAAQAVIVADEQSLDRLLSGGEPAFVRALERHSDVISGIQQRGRA